MKYHKYINNVVGNTIENVHLYYLIRPGCTTDNHMFLYLSIIITRISCITVTYCVFHAAANPCRAFMTGVEYNIRDPDESDGGIDETFLLTSSRY